ncbi:Clavaminate synthase-like protein [Laetiporus sulphureus 93-53]|uniref:Clavaminate synthase-like protein n=1 Tax=Laetiporus sulphureus 93-53 TaxID=1314785 RepID=A0A165HDM7_9APHY|nr:Clavaminate synthase-like protein [Laetiporus sulphureus 93-53]KZT11596.1 Clavaminate synthase-like protein [Laetiporus sulphureus 93-53]
MSAAPHADSSLQRRLYTDASILRALVNLCEYAETLDRQAARSAIASLDKAIIIAGAPGERRLQIIYDIIEQIQSHCLGVEDIAFVANAVSPNSRDVSVSPLMTLESALSSVPRLDSPPSLAAFVKQYSQSPFVLPGYIRDWPALHEHPWKFVEYLRYVAGPGRLVPVEIGNDYRQDDWTQALMPWDTFLDALDQKTPDDGQTRQQPLYLAQHNLLKQFPKLRNDILIPDYAYASLPPPAGFPGYVAPANDDQLVLNAWLGPSGAVSPAHTDPYYNFYAQVVGRKTVWLSPPDVTPSMYPYPPPSESTSDQPHNPAANNASPSMSNTSRVDVFQRRDDAGGGALPLFWKDVVPRAMSVTLEPGDLLFFPPGWWHAMRGEETSFSVSMWF